MDTLITDTLLILHYKVQSYRYYYATLVQHEIYRGISKLWVRKDSKKIILNLVDLNPFLHT